MKYLTIDTTTKVTALSLAEDGKLMAEGFLHTTKNHSERLIPMLDQLMKTANWELKELSLIGVVRGPGSFTGIRIGIATGQGLAQVLRIPVIGVLSLDALAWAGWGREADIVPILDARKNEWYTARYSWLGKADETERENGTENAEMSGPKCLTQPKAIAPDDWLAELKDLGRKICFVGDAAEKNRSLISSILGENGIALPEYQSLPRGAYAAQAVWYQYRLEQLKEVKDPETGREYDPVTVEPFYIRLSEAEVNWAKKEEARKQHDER